MEYDCEECHTQDKSKYTTKGYKLCRDCKLKSKNKTYSCKFCGVKDREFFEEGRYSRCKKCKNKKVLTDKKDFNLINNDSNYNPQIKKCIDRYVKFDYDMFEGYSIKDKIDTLIEENNFLMKENEKLKNEVDILNNKVAKILSHFNDKFIKGEIDK
jgi:hypothetical protein